MGYNYIVNTTDLVEITKRLDEIINLLKVLTVSPSRARRIVDGIATGAGILGIISVVDIIKVWLGG